MSVVNPAPIFYPFSDGKRMAENTKQARWIFTLYGNLQALYRERPDVFVAADNLWYPVEGEPTITTAPDVYVVIGRGKEDRLCYKQWEEGGIPPTVTFEVLSPSNTDEEMDDKLMFYDEHGVQEYYSYDPDSGRFRAWVRGRATLAEQRVAGGFRSPLMGVRFDPSGDELRVFHPNGDPFLTLDEVKAAQEQERRRADAAEARAAALATERDRVVQERDQTVQERDQAVQELDQKDRQLDSARAAALSERERARRMRDLGRLQQAGRATPEELDELTRLQDSIDGGP